MCDKKCYICLEEDENTIKTDCNHYYHIDCLLKLTYPKCPLCKNDLTNMLTKYKSIKNIKNSIKCENLRLFLNAIPDYNELDETTLIKICSDIKKFNRENHYEKIYKIIESYLKQDTKPFQEFFCKNNETTDMRGIYIYYIDIESFYKNIIFDYKFNVLKWFPLSEFENNKEFYVFSKGLYNKTCDEKNKYGVLIVIKDNKKIRINPIIIENTNITSLLPSQKSMISSLCENENLKLTEYKQNPEYDYVYFMNGDKVDEIFNYDSIYDFLISYFDCYMKNMIYPVCLEFCIFNKESNIKNIFTYDVFNKNNKVKFFIKKNSNYVSTKKLSNFIESNIALTDSFFIKVITYKNITNAFLYDEKIVKYISNFYGIINKTNFQYILKHITKYDRNFLYDDKDYLTNIDFETIYV